MKALDKKLANAFIEAMKTDDSEYNYSFDHGKLQGVLLDKQLGLKSYPKELVKRFGVLCSSYTALFKEIRTTAAYNAVHRKIDELDRAVVLELPRPLLDASFCYGLSIRAYNYYKAGQYNLAIQTSEECVNKLDKLIMMGIEAETGRLIQQYVNIVQVLFHLGETEKVKAVWQGIMEFLFFKNTKKLDASMFNRAVYPKDISLITEQTCMSWLPFLVSQIAILEKKEKGSSEPLFNAVFSRYYHQASIDTLDRAALHDWISIQKHYYTEKELLLIRDSTAFFLEYPSKQYRFLKRVLCQQAKDIFLNQNQREAVTAIEQHINS